MCNERKVLNNKKNCIYINKEEYIFQAESDTECLSKNLLMSHPFSIISKMQPTVGFWTYSISVDASFGNRIGVDENHTSMHKFKFWQNPRIHQRLTNYETIPKHSDSAMRERC